MTSSTRPVFNSTWSTRPRNPFFPSLCYPQFLIFCPVRIHKFRRQSAATKQKRCSLRSRFVPLALVFLQQVHRAVMRMLDFRQLPIQGSPLRQRLDQSKPLVRAVQIVKLPGYRAKVSVNSLEDLLRSDWSVVHMCPLDLVSMLR